MAKVGRPKQDECKNHKIAIRLTDEEYERLMQYVQKNKTTITRVTQKAINEFLDK